MHYQEEVDKVFNNVMTRHRTLRTLFDCFSTEWTMTSFQAKEEILLKLMASPHPLSFYVEGYRYFYMNELANKEHVLDSLDRSIHLLKDVVKDQTLCKALEELS